MCVNVTVKSKLIDVFWSMRKDGVLWKHKDVYFASFREALSLLLNSIQITSQSRSLNRKNDSRFYHEPLLRLRSPEKILHAGLKTDKQNTPIISHSKRIYSLYKLVLMETLCKALLDPIPLRFQQSFWEKVLLTSHIVW